jgi:hypothetical protein
MNIQKLKYLFKAAKGETPALPTEGFDTLVMQQIRRNPARPPFSIFDQLGLWFPRVALAAGVVIVLCIAGDLTFSPDSSLDDTTAQLSEQMLFAEN